MHPARQLQRFLLVALLAPMPDAWAISIRPDRPVVDYNELALENRFSSAGYIQDVFGQFCSGTLMSPTQVLTASHCFDDDADGQVDSGIDPAALAFGLETNLPDFSSANISQVTINPQWINSNGDPAFDLAVLTLTDPILDVVPAKFTDANPLDLVGTAVGYGEQGRGNNFPSSIAMANDRLAANNVIDSVTTTIETDFDSPQGDTSTLGFPIPLQLEGTTGPGDSGGPLFADFDGVTRMVGVLFGGFNDAGGFDSEYGDVSIWAALRNSENLSFLAGFGLLPIAPGLQGDYNGNGRIDAADYTVWRDASVAGTNLAADGNEDGVVDQLDYTVWKDVYGNSSESAVAIPEPAGALLLAAGLFGTLSRRR